LKFTKLVSTLFSSSQITQVLISYFLFTNFVALVAIYAMYMYLYMIYPGTDVMIFAKKIGEKLDEFCKKWIITLCFFKRKTPIFRRKLSS
jgi:hypothetical protein